MMYSCIVRKVSSLEGFLSRVCHRFFLYTPYERNVVLEQTKGGNFERAYIDLIRTDGEVIVKGAKILSKGTVV
ncbi:MAG: hypothetical protein ACP5MI_05360 [Candidatus Kryptoniota bacterium]